MRPDILQHLLEQVASGAMEPTAALDRLRTLPFEQLDFATVDHHRALRCGFPEVIFGQGKTPEHVAEIFTRLVAGGGNVVATRVAPDAAERVCREHNRAEHHVTARMLTLRQGAATPTVGTVGVVCAGTSDLPVAEEARLTLEMLNQRTECFYDVGVAGLHRLLAHTAALRQARVLIVVAGMEGALPSVVAGLVAAPVIAVPTSIGYGASFQGLAALLGMLNTCAPGVSVVNIDNGFGAACQAAAINQIGEHATLPDAGLQH